MNMKINVLTSIDRMVNLMVVQTFTFKAIFQLMIFKIALIMKLN